MVIGDLIILALTCQATMENRRQAAKKKKTYQTTTRKKICSLIMDNEKVRLLMRTLSGNFDHKLVDAHVHAQTHKQLWPEAKSLLK